MKKILVAVNNDDFSKELVAIGAALCKNEKGELYLLNVIEVPLSLPLDAEPESDITNANRLLDKYLDLTEELRVKSRADMVSARSIGGGIISYANNKNIDLIIAGLRDYPGFGDVISSPEVEYILKKAPCRVMIVRQGREQQK